MFLWYSIEAATMVIGSAMIVKTRVSGIAPIVIEITPAVAEVPSVMLEVGSAVTNVSSALVKVLPAMAEVLPGLRAICASVFRAPVILLPAFLIGFGSDGKRWNHQGPGNQSRQN
jgi:hypothetical protein